jgi:hypothetical protein
MTLFRRTLYCALRGFLANGLRMMMNSKLSALAGWVLIVRGSVVLAAAAEPLGTVPPGALVLDQGWQMQSTALISDDGAKLSTPGPLSGAWYETRVPTTVLSALLRHGV